MIAGVRDDILNSLKSKPLNPTTPVIPGDQTFNTTQFTGPDGLGGRLDITAHGNRFYAVLMLYPVGHAGSPDIDAFFGSFKLVAK
jgi:hypothetical protein